MTTIAIAEPTTTRAHGRHRKARRIRPVRLLTGLLLGVLAVGAVTMAALVLLLHIGFAPVLSPSMQPAFAPGDLLLTRTEPAADIHVGDVVVLPRPDAPGERYAHRVISVRAADGGPIVRTKGDANTAAEPQALHIVSKTVPVVIGHVPAAGRVALLGQYVWLRLALILFIGSCVLVAIRRAFVGARR